MFWVFDQKLQICHTMNAMFFFFFFLIKTKWQVCSKKTKLFANVHPNLWQNTFCWNFWKDPFFVKKNPHFSLILCVCVWRGVRGWGWVCVCVCVWCVCLWGVCGWVCVIFASLNALYFENWARIPVSILEISALGDLNKYLDDMSGSNPIWVIRLCVTHNA